MKRLLPAFLILALFNFLVPQKASAYMVKYKEDYWKLFHVHYAQYPDDVMENIYWLEQAVKADFCNPLYAPCKIDDEKDWEKYRYLFMMHINLKLIEQHMRLGRVYDKQVARFYDQPWSELYIENLKKSLSCYEAGLYYWEDERERIGTGKLDYKKILTREITRVKKVISDFENMDKSAY